MKEVVSVQWFPGHMAKTRRILQSSLPKVDLVAEIIDARIPVSSRNPEIDGLIEHKPHVILMNKADIADPEQNQRWMKKFSEQSIQALAVDCRSGAGLNRFVPLVRGILKERIAGWEAKGMVGHTVRVMVVGIPNVGKSSFINRMAKGGIAKVEDRPGVTRGNQWFTVGQGFELLDTPGVLWPKFDSPAVGEKLAFVGSVRDEVLDTEHLAARLVWRLRELYPAQLCARYKLPTDAEYADGMELLESIGRKRGMLISGGEIDLERAAITVLDEFRGGKVGRITLEKA